MKPRKGGGNPVGGGIVFDKWEYETIEFVKLKRAGFTVAEIDAMDPFFKADMIVMNDVINALEGVKL